jgi:hypothetical protein
VDILGGHHVGTQPLAPRPRHLAGLKQAHIEGLAAIRTQLAHREPTTRERLSLVPYDQ